MPAVRSLNDMSGPTWDDVASWIHELQSETADEGVTVAVDEDAWLIAYYLKGYGFFLSGCASGDTDYFTLVNSSLGDQAVRVWMAGEYVTRPRKVFVTEELVLKALRTFFDNGTRDAAMEWCITEEL